MFVDAGKRLPTVFTIFLLSLVLAASSLAAQPPYAKWGRIAVQETMKKYPRAQIVDYLHVGRKNKTATTSEETFKLLLQEGNRRWAVFVRIEFQNATEQVVAIRISEG
jgi:hypothetical protein